MHGDGIPRPCEHEIDDARARVPLLLVVVCAWENTEQKAEVRSDEQFDSAAG